MTTIMGNATRLPFDDDSIHCIVTSPPYNAGVDYPGGYDDTQDWLDYMGMARQAAQEMERVLVQGGRVWVNIAPTIPLKGGQRVNLGAIWIAALEAHFSYRDTIVWIQDSFDGGCAWGSWLKPSAPNLRGSHELILSYFKPRPRVGKAGPGAGSITGWHRAAPDNEKDYEDAKIDIGGEWQDLCRNVWTMQPSRNRTYPATFPIELPARCIRLSTWPGERVLDPFAGSGTTVEAAERLGRVGIGVDIGALVLPPKPPAPVAVIPPLAPLPNGGLIQQPPPPPTSLVCRVCDGHGEIEIIAKDGSCRTATCGPCDGSGRLSVISPPIPLQMTTYGTAPCNLCNGTGEVLIFNSPALCTKCHGSGLQRAYTF